MAKMIPATLPLQTESKAERRLFSVLRNGLDDSFTVFHSFNLLTQNRQGKFIDGEIDYLISLVLKEIEKKRKKVVRIKVKNKKS